MLIGGVIADRHDRRRLLTGSQYVQVFSAFTLAALVLTGHVNVWYIFALSFISGCGQAFGGPAYQSMIPSLVPRRDLPNAIALNSTQFNLSRVLGPMAGGIVARARSAPRAASRSTALSFFIVVFALVVAASAAARAAGHQARARRGAEERPALRARQPLMLTLTILVFVSTFLAMPILTMLPAFATERADRATRTRRKRGCRC